MAVKTYLGWRLMLTALLLQAIRMLKTKPYLLKNAICLLGEGAASQAYDFGFLRCAISCRSNICKLTLHSYVLRK